MPSSPPSRRSCTRRKPEQSRPLNFPIRLNNKLAALGGIVSSADTAPTDQSYTLYEELVTKIDAQLQRLNQVMTTDLKAFNSLVRSSDIPAVIVKPTTPPATAGQ